MNPFTPFLTSEEAQYLPYFDTANCTDYSVQNLFETYLNRMLKEKTMSIDNATWLSNSGYLDKYGSVNCNDQYNGILSGNVGQGNTFEKVIESVLRDGLVPESMFTDNPSNLAEYYDLRLITPAMRVMGQEFLKRFKIEILSEFAPLETLNNDLLWLTINVCPGYGVDSFIKTCVYPPVHAVLGYDIDDEGIFFFDSYPPYKKKISKLNISAKWSLKISEVNQLNNTMFTNLIREKGRKEVYAKINNKNYYIGEYAFADLLADKQVKWEDIKEVDFVINLDGVIK